jgi:predicted amidophosphoribosyltransferase
MSLTCQECGRASRDSRWWPLCPACYENLHHEQRREQIRPPELESASWTDPASLEAGFDAALGPKLP